MSCKTGNNSMHTLLYVFPEPLPLQKARAIQVVQTLHALAQQPLKITLAYVPTPGNASPFAAYGLDLPANLTLLPLSNGLGWPLHRLPVHSGKLFQQRLLAWLRKGQRTGKGPDAILVRHVKLAARLLQADPQLPLIYEAHEVFSAVAPTKKAPQLAAQEALVLQKSRAVIAITRQLAERLQTRYDLQRSFTIIPSATALPTRQAEKDWQQAGKRIVYAGSMYGWKGVDDLVTAAADLPADCEIHLVGGTPEAIEKLRQAAPTQGAKLVFHGYLSHQETLAHLERACIAVLPNRAGSVSDFTSPLKLFEYMAAGCAIVASDLPVLREILDDDNAAWFPAGDAKKLAETLRNLLATPTQLQAMAQQTTALARQYTWTGRADKLFSLLRDVAQAS